MRNHTIIIASLIVTLIVSAGVVGLKEGMQTNEERIVKSFQKKGLIEKSVSADDIMLFIVRFPITTPIDDTIVMHYNGKKTNMHRFLWNYAFAILNKSDFPHLGEVRYGYSRGGFWPFGEIGMDILAGSHFAYATNQTVVFDEIEWKWLPSNFVWEPPIPTKAGKVTWEDREMFAKGIEFNDFWTDSWPKQYQSSIVQLNENSVKWIELSPPWDYASVDPPVIAGEDVPVPTFPDEKLREHIRVFKDAGFDVLIRAQVCCSGINSTDRSDEWWEQWYDTYEDFVQYHADVVREEGANALLLSHGDTGLPLHGNSPEFAHDRWIEIIETAKTSNAPVGMQVHAHNAFQPIGWTPWPGDYIDFWEELDFVGIASWGAILEDNTASPTQAQIDAGVSHIMEHVDTAYDLSQKPLVLMPSYGSYLGAAEQKPPPDHYTWMQPEEVPLEHDQREQAMIYEAFMKETAQRDYIVGIFPFGYWYADGPLTVDQSVRGKMAERILKRWFDTIPE